MQPVSSGHYIVLSRFSASMQGDIYRWIKYIKKCGTCHQGGFWEDSFPSASVNARQKSSIKFAIIKCTTYHRVTAIAGPVNQVFLPGHLACHNEVAVNGIMYLDLLSLNT